MRTTLTLDDDVAVAVERRRREHQHTLKREVNELLRIGLLHADEQPPAGPGLRIKPWNAGRCLVGNIDNTARVLEMIEDERL